MCQEARNYYKDQFAAHPNLRSPIEIEADSVDHEIEELLRNQPSIPISITYQYLHRSILIIEEQKFD
ncbi:unnamed protein product, partial [Rotaria sp. Silwood2]